MTYVVYNIDHIHHLLNKSKKSKFAYNSNRREYCFSSTPYITLGILSNIENNIFISQEYKHLFLFQSMNTFNAKYEHIYSQRFFFREHL